MVFNTFLSFCIVLAEPAPCESDKDCLKGKAKCVRLECHCTEKLAIGDGKTECKGNFLYLNMNNNNRWSRIQLFHALKIVNWSVSCKLGFLKSFCWFMTSVFLFIVSSISTTVLNTLTPKVTCFILFLFFIIVIKYSLMSLMLEIDCVAILFAGYAVNRLLADWKPCSFYDPRSENS